MGRGVLVAAAVLGCLLAAAPARAGDEWTQDLANAQHSNSVPDSALRPPLRQRWRANLGVVRSNVIVSRDRVFYVRQRATNAALEITALRLADGAVLWSRTWEARTFTPNGLAIEGDRVFFVRSNSAGYPRDIHVEAIEAASGATIWRRHIAARDGPSAAPVVADGELYFLGSDSGATLLYSLRQSDGADRWPPAKLQLTATSSPMLDGSSVYVSLFPWDTYAIDRATGAQRWHTAVCCPADGGTMTTIFDGRLFADHGLIHDPAGGVVLGTWPGDGFPVWSGSAGIGYESTTLRGFGPGYEATRWRFGIDEHTRLARPLIAGTHVYTSTLDRPPYRMLGLRLGDGAPVWCPVVADPSPGGYPPLAPSPVAAGGGLLLVDDGEGLAAFESGGERSDCGAVQDPPPGSTVAPELELRAARRAVRRGHRTKVVARLAAVPEPAGRTVAIEIDEWPLDGRFERAARGRTARDGSYTFTYSPRRNARLRARLVGEPGLVSRAVSIYAELPRQVRKRNPGGRRPRLRVIVRTPPRAKIRKRPVYGYLARGSARSWRRVAHARWELRRRSVRATLTYPRGRLRQGDRWIVCVPERKPDAFGRPRRIDPLCGRPTLPR